MSATQGSVRSFRALSVLLVLLLLAMFVILMLLVASEISAYFPMLRDFSHLLSAEADATRTDVAAMVIVLLGAVALPVAVILISILLRNARLGEQRRAAEYEQQQRELQVLHSSVNALAGTCSAQVARISLANEQIIAASTTCREVSQQLLEGSRFESAHLLAAGGVVSKTAAVMEEMTVYAEESAAVARESMQMGAVDAGAAEQGGEAFYYLADFLRRIAQVSEKQSGSVAGVGKSIESVSEISRRSAASAAVLSECSSDLGSVADDLEELAEKQGQGTSD